MVRLSDSYLSGYGFESHCAISKGRIVVVLFFIIIKNEKIIVTLHVKNVTAALNIVNRNVTVVVVV